ncbi:MAG: Clp protease N-terminal domain-containing protein [Micromonosporaceae bacterium]
MHKRFSSALADRLIAKASPPSLERFTARARSTLTAASGGAQAGEGGDAAAPPRPPLSDEASGALREALAEALERGHNYIATEHMLLGLYRMPDSLAARILGGLGAGHGEAKVRLDEMLRSLSARS